MISDIRILESTVYPVLTYVQTRVCTMNQFQKIQVTFQSIIRNILKIKLKDEIEILDFQKNNKIWNNISGIIKKTEND